MTRRWEPLLIGSIALGLIAGFALLFVWPGTPERKVIVEQHASYADLSREEMIDSADAIFVGNVVGISPTRWNQDSGEAWNDEALGGDSGLQVHYVEVEILQPIVDTVGLDRQTLITAVGGSPLDSRADHDLKEGVQAVFFVVQTELAWRGGGTRPVLEFMTAPAHSYFRLEADGLYHDGRPDGMTFSLDEIIRLVALRRAT